MVDADALKLAGKDAAARAGEKLAGVAYGNPYRFREKVSQVFTEEWNRAIADAERLTQKGQAA